MFTKLCVAFLGVGSYAAFQVFFISIISKNYLMEELGSYAFVFSLSTVFFFLTSFSFRQLIVTSSYFTDLSEYFRLRLFLSLFTVFFISLFFFIFDNDNLILCLLICSVKFFESLSEIFYSIHQKNQNHLYQSKLLFSKSLFSAVLAIVLVELEFSLNQVVLSILFIHVFSFFFYELKSFKILPEGISYLKYLFFYKNNSSISLLKTAFPLGVGLFLINLNLNSSRIFSGFSFSESDTAVIAACLQLSLVFAPIVTGFSQVLLPFYVRLIKDKKITKLRDSFLYLNLVFLVATILVVFLSYFFGSEVLEFIYNKMISDFYFVFFICTIGVSFNYLASLSTSLLTAFEVYKEQQNTMIMALIVNISLMFALSPIYGIYSVVISFALSSFVRLSLLYFYACKNIKLME